MFYKYGIIIAALILIIAMGGFTAYVAYKYHMLTVAAHKAVIQESDKFADMLLKQREMEYEADASDEDIYRIDGTDLIDRMCAEGTLTGCPSRSEGGGSRTSD
jgi:hypothetical protein